MGGDQSTRGAMQMSRRGACGVLAGIAAAPLAGNAASALAAPLHGGVGQIRYVLTDRRHPESLTFAAPFVRAGVRRLEVTDGLTKLWRVALVPLWREAKGDAIVGLTRRETWDCVAEQARSCGRRSVLAAHHAMSIDGSLAGHALTAPSLSLIDAAALETCGLAWPGVMADLAMRCPAGGARSTAQARFPARASDGATPPYGHLVSWRIA